MKVVKLGSRIPVNIRDGVPLCPCCAEPMVEVEPDVWQCATGAAIWGSLRDRMAALFPDTP